MTMNRESSHDKSYMSYCSIRESTNELLPTCTRTSEKPSPPETRPASGDKPRESIQKLKRAKKNWQCEQCRSLELTPACIDLLCDIHPDRINTETRNIYRYHEL